MYIGYITVTEQYFTVEPFEFENIYLITERERENMMMSLYHIIPIIIISDIFGLEGLP